MTNYELMFIIEPTIDEEAKANTIEKVKELVTSNGGEVQGEDIWGMRKLAYPINKKDDGYYVVLDFAADVDFPKELDRRLKISDDVIRHMVINKDAR